MRKKHIIIGLIISCLCAVGYFVYHVTKNHSTIVLDNGGIVKSSWENKLFTMELIVDDKLSKASRRNGQGQSWQFSGYEGKIILESPNIYMGDSTNKLHMVYTAQLVDAGDTSFALTYLENIDGETETQTYQVKIQSDGTKIRSISVEK